VISVGEYDAGRAASTYGAGPRRARALAKNRQGGPAALSSLSLRPHSRIVRGPYEPAWPLTRIIQLPGIPAWSVTRWNSAFESRSPEKFEPEPL